MPSPERSMEGRAVLEGVGGWCLGIANLGSGERAGDHMKGRSSSPVPTFSLRDGVPSCMLPEVLRLHR